MLKVKDIMTKEVKTVSPETEITKAAKLLLSERINGVPVVNKTGELVGILCRVISSPNKKASRFPHFLRSWMVISR